MNTWIFTVLVTLPGVWSGDWKVTVENQCALKGSSVLMKCQYDYPLPHIVTSVSWFKMQGGTGTWKLLLTDSYSTSSNYKYRGDKWSNCDLEIRNVQPADEGTYAFSFETTISKWPGTTQALLSVRELTAAVKPRTVTEGDEVTLTCWSGCPGTGAVLWFRDDRPVPSPVFQARRQDAGRYHCAVFAQPTVRSDPVALDVRYAPDRVRLSLSPPRAIVQGGSVALMCTSAANPLVTWSGYRFYKDGQVIGEGFVHTISDIQPGHSGEYHCQAWNNVSRGGFVLFNSTSVQLDVQYRPTNISVSVSPPDAAVGGAVNVSCSCAANPAANTYTWYKRAVSPDSSPGAPVQVGTGPMLSLPSVEGPHAGLYVCRVKNRVGDNNSTEVLLSLEGERLGDHTLPVLVGVGASLVVTLLMALLLFWRKRRKTEKKASIDIRLAERGPRSPPAEEASDSIYANVPPSAPLSASQNNSHRHAPASHEDEVMYSTVTIKPHSSPHQHPINNRAAKDSRSEIPGGNNNSVIYAYVKSH